MADVQLEHGYFKVANTLYEAVTMADFTAAQVKIVLCIMRLTYGWQRKTVTIPHGELATRCGLKLSGGFRRAFYDLLEHRVVFEVRRAEGRTQGVYAMNKDYESWGKYAVAANALESLYGKRPASNTDLEPLPAQADGRPLYLYYAKDRSIVKIGASRNPLARLESFRTARPEITLVGIEHVASRADESERHRRFSADRIRPDREWFKWSDEIAAYVAGLKPITALIEAGTLGKRYGRIGAQADPLGSGTPTDHAEQHDPTGSSNVHIEGNAWVTPPGADPDPTGHGSRPTGSHTVVASVDAERVTTLERHERHERQTTRATATAPESATEPELGPTATVARDPVASDPKAEAKAAAEARTAHAFSVRMAVACNDAITARFGERPRTVHFSTGAQLATDVVAAGIPLELALTTIASVTAAKKDKPPYTLEYFRPAIFEASKDAEQRELNRANKTNASGEKRGGPPTAIQLVVDPTTTKRAKDQQRTDEAQYDNERRRVAIAWGKDPKNRAAFSGVVARVRENYASLATNSWTQKAIDSETIVECATKAGFPDFDTWRSRTVAKTHAKHDQAGTSKDEQG